MTDAMTTQIKAMLDQIAQLTKAIANKENAPNGGGSNSGSNSSGTAAGTKDKSKVKMSIRTSHTPWVATAHHMVSILLA